MKLTHKPAICITRLRKQSTFSNSKNQAQSGQLSELSESVLNITSDNKSRINLTKKPPPSLQQSRFYTSTPTNTIVQQSITESHSYQTTRIPQRSHRQTKQQQEYINQIKQLNEKIEHLTSYNQELNRRNQQMSITLVMQRNEKTILKERIEKLEASVQKISQQLLSQQKKQIQKPTIRIFSLNPSLKSSMVMENKVLTQSNRRLSFHEEPQGIYKEQDPSKLLKQYKNQLQLEKLKRCNFEIQLKNCKENAKIQYRNQNQNLHRKVKQLLQTIASKDKEISEKDGIINRCLIKKPIQSNNSLP